MGSDINKIKKGKKMKEKKQLIYYIIEQVLLFSCLLLSTFMFVKTTGNLLIYYIWANLIAIICMKIPPPENKILNLLYYTIIQPIGIIYFNFKSSFLIRPVKMLIMIIINIIITTVLVAAGWFVTATAYLVTSIITYNTYEDK